MLYALAVGAGQSGPLAELHLSTENSIGHELQVLPTFAAVLAQRMNAQISLPSVDRGSSLHAGQNIIMKERLPVEGAALLTCEITGLEFKRTGALVHRVITAIDDVSGKELFSAQSSAFLRGQLGTGAYGAAVPTSSHIPDRPPSFELHVCTRPDQALLYRLTGDRNPLHSDPEFASQSGFAKPILHGLCTYGVTARALLNELCREDLGRFAAMETRFASPVWPGQTLHVRAWRTPNGAAFQTLNDSGQVVLDLGYLTLHDDLNTPGTHA